MNQVSMDIQSATYQAISNTFPSIRKWNQNQKNYFFDLVGKYLFENQSGVMNEIVQLSNRATSIIISGYEISVEKNNFNTFEELEKYLVKIQKTELQKLLAQANVLKTKKNSIENLKKKLPTHCTIVNLANFKGTGLSGFQKWMNIFYQKKRS